METILVDLDGVLAKKNLPRLLAMYNDVLNLAIPAEQLARVMSLEAFHALPQARSHYETVGAARYQYQLELLRFHPYHIASCQLVDGALQSVHYLTRRCDALRYCTARVINFHPQWNADVARCTQIWLKNSGFPNADKIFFCDGPKVKLTTIAAMVREQSQRVLLIDDSLEKLLDAFDELPEDDQRLLREYLTLAAFGYNYDECDLEGTLPVIPFPNWSEVHNLAVNRPVGKEVNRL
ncbi:hypothetical protein [Dictyobacter aurantiacus]|uniref:hypothetical protein n=1 Tax=Dictyobacter aurantiacus TaxID=1936993 RepID=UPI000F841D00|nr:hypothetical protein [Dictyobacter aurantiacus]